MEKSKMALLFDAIQEIVDEDGNWQEKRARVLDYAKGNPDLETALNEFVSWFEDSTAP